MPVVSTTALTAVLGIAQNPAQMVTPWVSTERCTQAIALMTVSMLIVGFSSVVMTTRFGQMKFLRSNSNHTAGFGRLKPVTPFLSEKAERRITTS